MITRGSTAQEEGGRGKWNGQELGVAIWSLWDVKLRRVTMVPRSEETFSFITVS